MRHTQFQNTYAVHVMTIKPKRPQPTTTNLYVGLKRSCKWLSTFTHYIFARDNQHQRIEPLRVTILIKWLIAIKRYGASNNNIARFTTQLATPCVGPRGPAYIWREITVATHTYRIYAGREPLLFWLGSISTMQLTMRTWKLVQNWNRILIAPKQMMHKCAMEPPRNYVPSSCAKT